MCEKTWVQAKPSTNQTKVSFVIFNSVEVEQTRIMTKLFKKHKLAILNDVFSAVAVLDRKVSKGLVKKYRVGRSRKGVGHQFLSP